jgi:hypothetical protein
MVEGVLARGNAEWWNMGILCALSMTMECQRWREESFFVDRLMYMV